MARSQATPSDTEEAGFTLESERLGPLPLINHFIERMGVHDTLARHVASDARCAISHASALGVLLRSIIVEREPIYRQQETVHGFASGMFGVSVEDMQRLSDDRLGRALDRLYDADRTALLTELVLAVGERFEVRFEEFHNDSTTISLCGSYRAATGRKIRGRTAPVVTYGHSKQHRPDLKQLLFILTMSADGNVPVAFRCTDGNASDSRTHIETWNTLKAVAGRADFLYVADSKLCSRENMDHIDRAGGRFVTVMPRSRQEDSLFRQAIQTRTPEWTLVWDRPNPRYADGPRDCWYVHRASLPSMESWSIVWVWSTLLTLRQHARRRAQPGRRRGGTPAAAPAPGLGQGAAARRRRDRPAGQAHPGQVPRRPLPEGAPRRARRAPVQANPPRPPRPRHRLPQDHQAALRRAVEHRPGRPSPTTARATACTP